MKRLWVVVAGVTTVLCAGVILTSGEGDVVGTVVDTDGDPASDCIVSSGHRYALWPTTGDQDLSAAATNQAGRARTRVPNGLHRITINCPDRQQTRVTVLVVRGMQGRFDVVLRE